ncbi:hypothetical protein [Corallococcus caeni]|uniref:DUF11 domain-containing protein n=1 Tax=Corallococcus caeni TaxID=3082388 RepID=A0ABQ6R1U5_9BACT|nr:hypothetical protein ASNO1_65390 [Corallococcus sp. NO1]
MRVWRIILGLGLCAGVARAEWRNIQTQTGIPKDVTVFRPGFFAVATDTQLYVSRDGGVTTLNEGMAGSFLRGPECVVGIRTDGTLRSVGGCSPADDGKHLFPDDGNDYEVRAVRVTADGGVGYAVAAELPLMTPQFRSSLVPSDGGTAEWGPLDNPQPGMSAQPQLAVLPPQADGLAQALFSVSASKANFLWYRGTTSVSYVASGITPPNSAHGVALLPGATPDKPLAFFGNDTGLFRGTLGTSANPFEPIPLAPGAVDALAFDVAGGSSAGTGFGLLLLKQSDGKVTAFSAEPVTPPALPGTLWRQNTDLPTGITQSALRLACADASYCVAILNGPAQNVLIYVNANAPNVNELPASLRVDEGTTQDVQLKLRDADGDAVRLSGTVRAPGSPLNVVQEPLDSREDSGLKLKLTAPPGICASQTSYLDLVASDGLRAHDTPKAIALEMRHTVAPGAPLGATLAVDGGAFFMGGPPGTLTPTRGTGCEPVKYAWTTPARAPVLTEDAVGVATLTPPSTRTDRCKEGTTSYNYEVRAYDGELSSLPATVPVQLHPWGPPDAPFTSGTREVYSGAALGPQATHLCAAAPGTPATPGLPPVSTLWSVLENPSGVSVLALLGNTRRPVGSEPLEGSAVLLASATCVDTLQLKLRAFNRITVDGYVLDGPPSDVDVAVKPRWVPVDAVRAEVTLEPPEERKVRGRVTTNPLVNCTGMRALSTVVTLEDPSDPSRVFDTRTYPWAAGTFELDLPPTCGGASYTVRTRVQEAVAEGSVKTPEVLTPFPRGARQVELGELDGELVATCGKGARGTLRQTIPEGACTAVDLTWTPGPSPELEPLVSQGDSVTLATVDTQLESLVGEHVTLDVTATGEGTREAKTRTHAVRIGARPFVTVERSTETTGVGTDSGQFGVTVTLRNDTACDVSSIRYAETVTGAQVLPRSVTLNGQPVTPVEVTEQHFEVERVPLPAGATATLTYVVRPALLTAPTYSGTATLREVVVSRAEAPPDSTSGCGCSGGGSGVTAFGLGALAWAARRRRGVRARS